MATKRALAMAIRSAGLGLALAAMLGCGTPTAGPTWSDPAAIGAALPSDLEGRAAGSSKQPGDIDVRSPGGSGER